MAMRLKVRTRWRSSPSVQITFFAGSRSTLKRP